MVRIGWLRRTTDVTVRRSGIPRRYGSGSGVKGFAVSRNRRRGSGSFVTELLQDLAEEAFHPIPDPWLLFLRVAGHVQGPDLVFRDPGSDLLTWNQGKFRRDRVICLQR